LKALKYCTLIIKKPAGNNVMRGIFGPIRTDYGYWRIKSIQEINDILKGQNIIGLIKKTKIKLVRPL